MKIHVRIYYEVIMKRCEGSQRRTRFCFDVREAWQYHCAICRWDVRIISTECDISVSKLLGFETFPFFLMVSVSVSKNFGIEKSIGIGFDKFWYRKKYRYRFRKFLVSDKVSVLVLNFLILNCVIFQVLSKSFAPDTHRLVPSTLPFKINKDSWRWVGYVQGMLWWFVLVIFNCPSRNTKRQQKRSMKKIFLKILLNKNSAQSVRSLKRIWGWRHFGLNWEISG